MKIKFLDIKKEYKFRFFVNLDSLLFNAYSFTELHGIPKVIEIKNLNS